jgi:hypothetical protein
MLPKQRRTEHDVFHERYLFIGMGLIVLDVILAYYAPNWFDGNPKASLMFLLPSIPVAFSALSHWIAGTLPATKCTCGKTQEILN